MWDLASGTETVTTTNVNWEMLIVLSNLGLIVVSIVLAIVTALNDDAMVKIVRIMSRGKRNPESNGRHSREYVTEHSDESR